MKKTVTGDSEKNRGTAEAEVKAEAKAAAESKAAEESQGAGRLPESEEAAGEPSAGEEAAADETAEAVAQELADVKDRYMRMLAEYDNYRKRSQKERESLYSDAVMEITKEWLPVLDNVERALTFAEHEESENSEKIIEGIEKIHKQAVEVLCKLGVEEIPCDAGTAFDPNLHSAVAHIDDENLGDQTVAQVFLKGYQKGDRVIRYTLVQVAN